MIKINFCKNNLFVKILVKSFFVKKYVRLKKDFVKKNWSLKLLVKKLFEKKKLPKILWARKIFYDKNKKQFDKKIVCRKFGQKNFGQKTASFFLAKLGLNGGGGCQVFRKICKSNFFCLK